MRVPHSQKEHCNVVNTEFPLLVKEVNVPLNYHCGSVVLGKSRMQLPDTMENQSTCLLLSFFLIISVGFLRQT